MKKVLMFLYVSLFLFTLASCVNNDHVTDTTTAKSTQPTIGSTTEKISDNSSTNTFESSGDYSESTTFPVYVPGSVKLMDPLKAKSEMELQFVPTYRMAYYCLMGELSNLVNDKDENQWYNEFWQKYDWNEPKEMLTVAFVKHFNISKDDFEAAVEKGRKLDEKLVREGSSIDLNSEMYELPNAAIIYTFDNDIINTYYLRK